MEKIYALRFPTFFGLFMLFPLITFSQVGINTTNPQTSLDIPALNPTGSTVTTPEGVLVPRVDRLRAQTMTAIPNSNLIFVDNITTGTATGKTVDVLAVGFYYFDVSKNKWIFLQAGDTEREPWNIELTTNPANSNTQNIYQMGNVGIGKNNPIAKLDVSADALINNITAGKAGGNINTNTAFGLNALAANTTGFQNLAIGFNALAANTTGRNNYALGYNNLTANTTGIRNIAIGENTLPVNNSNGNIGIGFNSLRDNTTGSVNLAMGISTLLQNTTGIRNISVGSQSLTENTTGSNNTSIGYFSLAGNSTGTFNTAIGSSTAYDGFGSRLTGSKNTFLGANSRYMLGTINNATAVGADIILEQSDSVILGNNANVGIGTTTPAIGLDVTGRAFGTKFSEAAFWDHLYMLSEGSASFISAGGAEDGLRFRVGQGSVGGYGVQPYTQVMTMMPSGYVGVGTTTPATKLDLTGIKTSGAGTGTGVANDAPTQAIVTAGSNGTSRFNDWPAGWLGGISTYDIVGGSTFMNANILRSDSKLKKEIKNIDASILTNFFKIRPVTYLMKEQTKEMEGLQYGFIAQEIRELFPSIVTQSSEPDGVIGMNYQALISPTIYVVQQQQAKIQQLEDELKTQNEKLTIIQKELEEIRLLLKK